MKNANLPPGEFKSPLVMLIPVTSSLPSLQDNTGDSDRLKMGLLSQLQGVERAHIPQPVLGRVASSFRGAGFKGFCLVNMLPDRLEIVDFLEAEPKVLPAVALDLGTTHMEATLLDLLTGRELARAHAENDQLRFGSDILTRIHFAHQDGEKEDHGGKVGLDLLQEAVVSSINGLVADLATSAGVGRDEVRAMTVSGNTTMVHFLLGLDPYHICREPYIPMVNSPDPCHARELGIDIAALAPVWVLPGIGSYFGGDLVSGILATGLDAAEETAMLIDVGTNAEVVLGNRDWLIACAGAAGPALEGGVARMGMRAEAGAIEQVSIDRENWQLSCRTIENAPARGICGSGLIDLVAELYLARIIDFRGKFQYLREPESQEQEIFLRERLIGRDNGYEFIVVPAAEGAAGEPVILSQTDLDAMMRSKAAMYAILTTLVAQVGVAFDDLHRIYVAGAFGRHINPGHAITLGMLPDLPLAVYEPVGNSSLAGAEMMLLSEECRRRSREIRRKITYLELNVNQEFMIRFSGSRFIPHTDPVLFPSVPSFRDSGA